MLCQLAIVQSVPTQTPTLWGKLHIGMEEIWRSMDSSFCYKRNPNGENYLIDEPVGFAHW